MPPEVLHLVVQLLSIMWQSKPEQRVSPPRVHRRSDAVRAVEPVPDMTQFAACEAVQLQARHEVSPCW